MNQGVFSFFERNPDSISDMHFLYEQILVRKHNGCENIVSSFGINLLAPEESPTVRIIFCTSYTLAFKFFVKVVKWADKRVSY